MNPLKFIEKLSEVSHTRGPGTAAKAAFTDIASQMYRPVQSGLELGRYIWESDADVVLVLDGARFDTFRDVSSRYDWLTGKANSAWSVGSSSSEWYGRTFGPYARTNWDLSEVGVITANPFSGKQAETAPGAPRGSLPLTSADSTSDITYLDELWRSHWGAETESGTLDIVDPEVVTHRTIDVWRGRGELGISKLVAHYMQPHAPFRSQPGWFDAEVDVETFGDPSATAKKDPWLRVRDGELPEETFWEAYLDNFDWVLESVERLIENIDAEILVTADHGNGFGEWGVWGHPARSVAPVLRRVPWVHLDGVDTGRLAPRDFGAAMDEEASVEERLESLGYK